MDVKWLSSGYQVGAEWMLSGRESVVKWGSSGCPSIVKWTQVVRVTEVALDQFIKSS